MVFAVAWVLCGALAVCAVAGCAAGAGGRKPVPVGPVAPEGVSFSVSPSDAEVLVDNVIRGRVSEYPDDHPLRIPVGSYALELRAPGYMAYLRKLEVAWQAKKIEATLMRKEEPPH